MNHRGGFKPEIAAAVLLAALYTTDEIACKQYGVSVRSLLNWRNRLAEDPEFAEIFLTKKRALDAAWAEKLPLALSRSIDLISECAAAIAVDPMMRKNPNVIHAIAGAIKICAEVHYTGKLIDARLADPNRPTGEILRSGASPEEDESPYSN